MQSSQSSKTTIESQVLGIVREFTMELGNDRAARAVNPHAALDKDLGLGSLERVELMLRLQQNFAVRLPERLVFDARTLKDLIDAITKAEPAEKNLFRQQTIISTTQAAIVPTGAVTLTEVLFSYANVEPKRPHIYLQQESGEEQIITYGQLLEASLGVAAGLLEHGLVQGGRVALMLPTSREFFYAFFGVLLAGGVPVPTYPPFRLDRIEDYAKRAAVILNNAEVQLLITGYRIENMVQLLRPFVPSLTQVLSAAELMRHHGKPVNVPVRGDANALIQYTSGSTGDPKGVQLTHYNLLSNIRAFGQALEVKPTDVVVSWLPLYHDMGLIGAWLGSLYFGLPVTILSPLTFLTEPQRWLWAIHAHRATISAAPNFAYELCVRRIPDEALEGLDLSCWRVALNGAEAVNPETISRFNARFKAFGLSEQTLLPVYGLAESSVGLTIPPLGRPARIDKINRQIFDTEHRAVPATADDLSPLQFPSCGKVLCGHEIRIVDSQHMPVAERVEGSLQFRGPSSMQGYFNAPEKTQAIYQAGWWDSGDFAYLADGEVYITGRRKDIIIKGGRNFYPQELEEIASEVPGVRKGCVVAFGAKDPLLGTEKIIIVAETREQQPAMLADIERRIIEKIVEGIDMPPDVVLLVLPGAIPKTSSGKLRRSSSQEIWLRNGFAEQRKVAPWRQIARLGAAGLVPRISNLLQKVGRLLYGVYSYSVLALTLIPAWLITLIIPETSPAAGKLVRYWAKGFLWLIGSSPKVTGQQNLAHSKALILVANHSSYLDALVLIATMPIDFAFVAKSELLQTPIIGSLIKKLHYITVDRSDFVKGTTELETIVTTLQQGRSVLIFPEGTFTAAQGVRPFKLGAFKAAVEAGREVCPIAIQGTRHILRSDFSWLPRHGAITVTILAPISPSSQQWEEIIRLRDATRDDIAKYCGEPKLNLVAAGPPSESE
ncbi:MAG TPA: 1-acylglycerol-3-phosphate O-acyltransferase [Gammaproteobacteria bacterium]|nr:1-acylglycerol-3-phosphate O-acyltransferase [Gammaproteobacteria bacterium]